MAGVCDLKKWGELQCQCLRAHNRYRQQHAVPPLILSKKLNKMSSKWAKKLATKGELQHSANTSFGENLFFCSGCTKITGDMVVKPWYEEIDLYDFAKAEFTAGTGHFTQVVWKESRELGVGFAKRGNNFYLVCHYFPPGNVRGRFRENVLPEISST